MVISQSVSYMRYKKKGEYGFAIDSEEGLIEARILDKRLSDTFEALSEKEKLWK